MAVKRAKQGKKADNNVNACELFFPGGGKAKVRMLLSEAVRAARLKAKMTPATLNKLCYFAADEMVGCEVFEKDHSKMTQEVFCRAACALGIKVEDVLKLDISKERLETITGDMKRNNAGLAAALSSGDKKAESISNTVVAPVYIRIKMLSEI